MKKKCVELITLFILFGLVCLVAYLALTMLRSPMSDAGVQHNLGLLQKQAKNDFETSGCYSDSKEVCNFFPVGRCPNAPVLGTLFADRVIFNQLIAARSVGGRLSACVESTSAKAYAIAVQISTSDTKAWCIDSRGTIRLETMAKATQKGIEGVIDSDTAACK